jgi:TRAP-type C4-dicarboxylate transport system substrate-binding protein
MCSMDLRRRLLLLVALTVLAAPGTGRADDAAKPREWKLSVAVGPAFALGQAADAWAKRIGERSGGALAVVLQPGASLAKRDPDREFGALRDGAADLAVGSTLHWSAQVEALAVVGLPWLAPEPRQLAQLARGEVKERLFAAIERAGAVPLALAPLGHRAIATRANAARVPDDIRGVDVRIASSRYLVDFYAGLGARPFAMPFAEAAAAFETGRLSAQEGAPAAFVAARVDALGLRHVTLWGAIAELAIFAVNRVAWDGWTAEQRAQVAGAAEDAATELGRLVQEEEQRALATLRDHGVELMRLTASGTAAFATAARPTYDKWAAIAGTEIVQAAEHSVSAPAR